MPIVYPTADDTYGKLVVKSGNSTLLDYNVTGQTHKAKTVLNQELAGSATNVIVNLATHCDTLKQFWVKTRTTGGQVLVGVRRATMAAPPADNHVLIAGDGIMFVSWHQGEAPPQLYFSNPDAGAVVIEIGVVGDVAA